MLVSAKSIKATQCLSAKNQTDMTRCKKEKKNSSGWFNFAFLKPSRAELLQNSWWIILSLLSWFSSMLHSKRFPTRKETAKSFKSEKKISFISAKFSFLCLCEWRRMFLLLSDLGFFVCAPNSFFVCCENIARDMCGRRKKEVKYNEG